MLSEKCSNTAYDGDTTRTAHIFPSPTNNADGVTGSFTLIEDDGKTNAHVERGIFTEIKLSFRVAPDNQGSQRVEVGVEIATHSYDLPYDIIWFVLPVGDTRELCLAPGSGKGAPVRETRDGRSVFGVRLTQ